MATNNANNIGSVVRPPASAFSSIEKKRCKDYHVNRTRHDELYLACNIERGWITRMNENLYEYYTNLTRN